MVKHIVIKAAGDVQGVWFRQSAKEEASKLSLTGTVRNLPDGTVEIHAEGEQDKLEELLKWCQQGPQFARVGEITRQELPARGYEDFRII